MSKKLKKEDSEESNFNLGKAVTRIDNSVEIALDKTDSVVNKILELIKNLYKFLKVAISKESIKKVLFIICMAISMSFVLMGINVIFGKVIL